MAMNILNAGADPPGSLPRVAMLCRRSGPYELNCFIICDGRHGAGLGVLSAWLASAGEDPTYLEAHPDGEDLWDFDANACVSAMRRGGVPDAVWGRARPFLNTNTCLAPGDYCVTGTGSKLVAKLC